MNARRCAHRTLKQMKMKPTREVIAILVLQKKRTIFQSICNGTHLVLYTATKNGSSNNGVQTKGVYNWRRNVGWIVTNWWKRFYGRASFSISTWKLTVAVMAINHLDEPTKCTGNEACTWHTDNDDGIAWCFRFVLFCLFFPKNFQRNIIRNFLCLSSLKIPKWNSLSSRWTRW